MNSILHNLFYAMPLHLKARDGHLSQNRHYWGDSNDSHMWFIMQPLFVDHKVQSRWGKLGCRVYSEHCHIYIWIMPLLVTFHLIGILPLGRRVCFMRHLLEVAIQNWLGPIERERKRENLNFKKDFYYNSVNNKKNVIFAWPNKTFNNWHL